MIQRVVPRRLSAAETRRYSNLVLATASTRSIFDHQSVTYWTVAVIGVLLATSIYLVFIERWVGVMVLSGTAACSLAFIRLQHLLTRLFNLLFVLAGAINAVAYVFNLWDRISPYDEFVHAYTTFAIAAAFGYLAFHRHYVGELSNSRHFLSLVIAFGLAIGAGWEVVEWAIGIIGDKIDTVVDLAMDTIGAAVAGLFCRIALNHQRKAAVHLDSEFTRSRKPQSVAGKHSETKS
jgi:hypothetical protein